MIEIDVTTRSAAPAERVFALLLDAAGWLRWAGVDEVTVSDGRGVGELRTARRGDATTLERVTVVQPCHRFVYEVVTGPSTVGHEVEVTLTHLPGRGTKIRWEVRCAAATPGTDELVRQRLERQARDAAEGLAHAAAAANAA